MSTRAPQAAPPARSERGLPAVFAVALCLGCCVGCGDKPRFVTVTGTVTLEGQPLPAGRILFEPVAGDRLAKSAVGDVREDGSFELYTVTEGDGVLEGTYYPVVMDPKEPDHGEMPRHRVGVVQLTEQQFQVTARGPHHFTVAITRGDVRYGIEDD